MKIASRDQLQLSAVAQQGGRFLVVRLRFLAQRLEEQAMNEDRFNMDIRKFLKTVGVTSQREIENGVREALAKGKLTQSVLLKPRVTLSIPELGIEHVVEGEIGLS
jgi:hypothetical protein